MFVIIYINFIYGIGEKVLNQNNIQLLSSDRCEKEQDDSKNILTAGELYNSDMIKNTMGLLSAHKMSIAEMVEVSISVISKASFYLKIVCYFFLQGYES